MAGKSGLTHLNAAIGTHPQRSPAVMAGKSRWPCSTTQPASSTRNGARP